MPSSILNSDDGVISGTSGLKSSGGDDGVLNIQNNGTTAVTVNASGRVGIGVTPASWESSSNTQALQIKNTSIFDYIGEASDFGANFYYDGGYKYIASFAATRYSQSSGAHIWYNVASGTAGNAITWVERARIHAAGGANVGGTGTDHFFQATSGFTDRSTICAQATSGSFADYNIFSNVNRNTTNNSYYHFRCRIQGVADKLLIADSGNVTNTNNSYGSISDVKLKQDIVDAGSQWDDIKGLRVRKYRWKSDPDGFMQMGLVAQEAEEVSPGLIDEHPDYEEIEVPVLDDEGNAVLNEDGTPQVTQERNALGTTTKAVKYSVLYMKAVKALQEAMERIETLEAKNDALEARIAALEQA